MTDFDKQPSFKALEILAEKFKSIHLKSLFKDDPNRFSKYSQELEVDGLKLLVDYSKNKIDPDVLLELFNLAKEANVEGMRAKMFSGEQINFTEKRSVLHVALRNRSNTPIMVNGKDVMPDVNRVLEKMKNFAAVDIYEEK